MGIIQTVVMAWKIIKWIRTEKKRLEADVDGYLTPERAREWRLYSEKVFKALASGNSNMKRLPKPIRWFFASTTADDRVGEFGMWYLKSAKLADKNLHLEQPLYRVH